MENYWKEGQPVGDVLILSRKGIQNEEASPAMSSATYQYQKLHPIKTRASILDESDQKLRVRSVHKFAAVNTKTESKLYHSDEPVRAHQSQ